MILLRGAPAKTRVPILRRDMLANPGLWVPLTLSGLAWLLLAQIVRQAGGLPLCIGSDAALGLRVHSALRASWALFDPRILESWGLMALAMMLPIAAPHLSVATAKALPRNRGAVLSAALAGYLGVWMLFALPYLGLFLLAQTLASLSPWPVGPVLFYGTALIWSLSRFRQSALRRCHAVPAFFGSKSQQVRAAGIWGAQLGLTCCSVCFLVMSAPMLSGQGLVGMFLSTHILLTERHCFRPNAWLTTTPLGLMGLLALLQQSIVS